MHELFSPSLAVTVTLCVPADWSPNVPDINPPALMLNPAGKPLALNERGS
jgi:hypothetical protein